MIEIVKDTDKDCYIFKCPSCDEYIIVNTNEVNCKIFRHGVFKKSHTQIDPHASKDDCDKYLEHDIMYGCGKPFCLKFEDDKWYVDNCEYI